MASINRAATLVATTLILLSLHSATAVSPAASPPPPPRPTIQSLFQQLRDICNERQPRAFCSESLKKNDVKTLITVTSNLGVKEAEKLANQLNALIHNKATKPNLKLKLKSSGYFLRQIKKNMGLPMLYMSEDPRKQEVDPVKHSAKEFADAYGDAVFAEDQLGGTPLFKDKSFVKTYNATMRLADIGSQIGLLAL